MEAISAGVWVGNDEGLDKGRGSGGRVGWGCGVEEQDLGMK